MNSSLCERVQSRLDRLTKPLGSLGRLEEIVMQFALARETPRPRIERKSMYVFCADHGIAAEGVSAYPQEVTAQMVRNFAAGGAAINVLCRQFGIATTVIDMGVACDYEPHLAVLDRRIARGTANFLRSPAMTAPQAAQSLDTGRALAREAATTCDLAGVGEMGIGNTTSATAILAAFTGRDPEEITGLGTGIGAAQRVRKAETVRRALALRRPNPGAPLSVLQAVGGFEIGAMAGFLLGAAESRLPVAVDGFIASSAALLAARISPGVLPYLFFSHRSAERGHGVLLEALGAKPILDLDLRLGEGTGAALAIGVIEAALRLYNEMATFESAGVTPLPDRPSPDPRQDP
jgi:nicotinate-nucleotide--dimethylbenzimidazole phosphoribosyltransferase